MSSFFKFRHWIRIHDVWQDAKGTITAGQDWRYTFRGESPPNRSFALVEGHVTLTGKWIVTNICKSVKTPDSNKYNTADPDCLVKILTDLRTPSIIE